MTAPRERFIAALALVFLCVVGVSEITSSPAIKDASETLRMALNLERHGVISIDEELPYQASMQREPVPIVTTAAAIYLTDRVRGEAATAQYFSGERVRCLKLQNLLWLLMLAVSVFAAVRRFHGSFWLALLGSGLAVSPFTWYMPAGLKMYIGMDSLDTDLAGAALLSAAVLLLSVGVAQRERLTCIAASVCFGVLALTKASIFYVYPVVLLILACYWSVAVLCRASRSAASSGSAMPRRPTPRAWYAGAAALAIPFLLVTSPWLLRNYADTGFFAIAERGGPVLLYRAFLDEVTPEEYLGAFSAWGNPYGRKLAGKLTGFDAQDLQAGGRLQRLAMQFSGAAQEREVQAEDSGIPEQTISWYRQSRAIYNQQLARFTAQGHRYPSGAADEATRNDAMRLIVQRPFKHLLLMVPLIWRGAVLSFPLLLATLLLAWKQDRTDLLVYALTPLALVGFFAAATHFSERYGYVPAPEATVCLMVLSGWAAARWKKARSG